MQVHVYYVDVQPGMLNSYYPDFFICHVSLLAAG